jgi:RND family efflux transporter MFP subunit
MGKMKIISNLAGVLIVALFIGLIVKLYISRRPEEPVAEPPEVTVANPVIDDIMKYDHFTGTTAAIASVEIRTRLEGFLDSVEFAPSAEVNEGDVLFIVEPEKYVAKRDEELARVKASEAELEKAQSELERVEEAIKAQAVSEQEVTSKRAQRDKAEAAVKAAKAILDEAELQLSYTRIFSPIEGRVSRNLVDAGNLVGAGENTLLTTVVTMDPIYAYFNVSESIILERISKRAREGHVKEEHYQFDVGLSNEEGYPHEGELDYIDNVVDPSTGTINVRGVFSNKDRLFLPGMFVRVRLPAGIEEDAIMVEEKAIGTDIGGKYLLIVGDDKIVEKRAVQTGVLIEGKREIVSGIEPGELYIVNGLLRARPGMPVQWKNGNGVHLCPTCQEQVALRKAKPGR